MTDAMTTAFLTVITGACVFVSGQIVIEFLVKPLLELRKVIGEICHILHYHAPVICNPRPKNAQGKNPDEENTSKRVRELASMYLTRTVQIPPPAYVVCALLRLTPSRSKAHEVYKSLIFISNAIGELALVSDIAHHLAKIELVLGITLTPKESSKILNITSK